MLHLTSTMYNYYFVFFGSTRARLSVNNSMKIRFQLTWEPKTPAQKLNKMSKCEFIRRAAIHFDVAAKQSMISSRLGSRQLNRELIKLNTSVLVHKWRSVRLRAAPGVRANDRSHEQPLYPEGKLRSEISLTLHS